MRGQHGVPSSIRTIVEDCEEAKDTLMDIADCLSRFLGKTTGRKFDSDEE